MPLALIVHELAPGSAAAKAMIDAIYEIAPEHWPMSAGTVLVAAGVSPTYLRDHLIRAMKGHEVGLLLVTRLGANAAWAGLPADGEAWLRETLE